MKKGKIKYLLWALIILSIGANIYFISHNSKYSETVVSAKEIYTCPMHPQVVSDHPGDCPICGMKLVKKSGAMGSADAFTDSITNSVKLSPSQEILANISVEKPQSAVFSDEFIVPGKILAKEEGAWKITLNAMIRVDKLFISTPGEPISAGEPVMEFYSPDITSAFREYRLAKDGNNDNGGKSMAGAALNKLRSIGLDDDFIAEYSDRTDTTFSLKAPKGGILMDKMVSEGEWAMPEMTLLEFQNCDKVWAEGALSESEIGLMKMGDKVDIISPQGNLIGRTVISYISPMVDMMTRNLYFRGELDNHASKWKLDSYIQIKSVSAKKRNILTLPDEAVLQTGNSTRVWVQVSPGHFQPRIVEIGSSQNGRTEIIRGLSVEEEVVVSGAYLLDANAQLKGFTSAPAKHPEKSEKMPGMDMSKVADSAQKDTISDKSQSPMKAEPAPSKQIYTCSMDPQIEADKPGRCPICGMKLVLKGNDK